MQGTGVGYEHTVKCTKYFEFIRQRPDDPFPRYALALELELDR